MEERYRKFISFNFNDNSEWNTYLNSLDPKPQTSQIFNLKKKFYKRKVDSEFDTEYTPSVNNTNTNTNTSTNTNTNASNSQTNTSPSSQDKFIYIYMGETFLLLYFLIKCLISSDSPLLIAALSLFARLLRLNWPIKFSKDYLAKIIPQDVFSYLIYAMIVYISSGGNKVYLYLIPTAITSILYISGFQRRHPNHIPAFLSKYIMKIRDYQENLLKIRNVTEIVILPLSVIGIFIGFNNFFLPIIYYQFLKMRVAVDQKLSNGLADFKNSLLLMQSPNGGVLNTILLKLSNACDYLKA